MTATPAKTTPPLSPTPWSYEWHELSEGYCGIVYDANGHAIADYLTEKDAALIAAAPALLEALQKIADGLADARSTPGQWMTRITKPEAYKIARAALSKIGA